MRGQTALGSLRELRVIVMAVGGHLPSWGSRLEFRFGIKRCLRGAQAGCRERIKVILYHYTAGEYLAAIAKHGLTVGDVTTDIGKARA